MFRDDAVRQALDQKLPHRDPGLQPERTTLAWTRTAFAVLANAILMLRAGWAGDSLSTTVLGLGLLIASALAFAQGAARRNQLATQRADHQARPQILLATATVGVAACMASIVSMLLTTEL